MDKVEFIKIGFSDEENKIINSNIKDHKKKINKVLSEARKSSKQEKCFYCGKVITSFCNHILFQHFA